MSIPEVKVEGNESEPRYTAAEWIRINADSMCTRWGHEETILWTNESGPIPQPVSITCTRCGRSWEVVK